MWKSEKEYRLHIADYSSNNGTCYHSRFNLSNRNIGFACVVKILVVKVRGGVE